MRFRLSKYLITSGTLGLLVASLPAGAVRLNPNGEVVELKAEQLESPYSQDERYVYSKSANFSRWVHSPWATPRFNGETLEIRNMDPEKRAMLNAEVNLETSHLNPARKYQLRFENDYLCRPSAQVDRLETPAVAMHAGKLQKGKALEQAEATTGHCNIRLTVRCYGKTASADWGITFEKVVKDEVSADGTFSANGISLPGHKCQQGAHLALETSVTPNLERYAFQKLRLGLTEQ